MDLRRAFRAFGKGYSRGIASSKQSDEARKEHSVELKKVKLDYRFRLTWKELSTVGGVLLVCTLIFEPIVGADAVSVFGTMGGIYVVWFLIRRERAKQAKLQEQRRAAGESN